MEGKIKWWSKVKGYGFIEGDDGQDVFFFHDNIIGESDDFEFLENERVSYEIQLCSQGAMAINVHRAESKQTIKEASCYLTEGWNEKMSIYSTYKRILKNISNNSLYENVYNESFAIQGVSLEECVKREFCVLLFEAINLKDHVSEDDLLSIECFIGEKYTLKQFNDMILLDEYKSGIVNIPILFKILCQIHKQEKRTIDLQDKTTSIGMYLNFIDSMQWCFVENDYDTNQALNGSDAVHYYWIALKKILDIYAQKIVNGSYTPEVTFSLSSDAIDEKCINNKEKMLFEYFMGADKIYCDTIEKSDGYKDKARQDPHWTNPSTFLYYETPRIYADITCGYSSNPGFLRMDNLLDSLIEKYEIKDDFVALQLFTMPMLYLYKNCQQISKKNAWIWEEYDKKTASFLDKYDSSLIGYEDTDGLSFGIITNSVMGAALYFAQDAHSRYSQIKKKQKEAQKEYNINMENASSEYRTLLWQTGIKDLDIYYELLKRNILLSSQLVASFFQIDYVKIFNLYQEYIQTKNKEELDRIVKEKEKITKDIVRKKEEQSELKKQYDAIGVVLLGEKAKYKKQLKLSIESKDAEIERLQEKLTSL